MIKFTKTFARTALTGLALIAMLSAAESKPDVKSLPKKKSADAAVFAEEAAAGDLEAKLVIDTNVPGEKLEASTSPVPVAVPIATVAAAPAALPKVETAKLPENEIPVLANVKETKKTEGGTLYRLMATLGVIAIALGAASFGLKKYIVKSKTSKDSTRIKVLTQHHLGPKKNLTIIQVAGETLLLGVTDQNISMLKTLSLLGDEIPDAVPTNFNSAMVDFEVEGPESERSAAEEDFTISGLSEVRDRISTKMKGMRRL